MITCRDAVESDMKAVARLHEACFQGTFIASLGEELIADYYREFLQEGGPFVLAFEDEKLVGLCMGYYAGSGARNAFVSKNKGRLVRRLLALCLSLNRVAIKKCFGYVFSRKKAASVPRAEADPSLDIVGSHVREFVGTPENVVGESPSTRKWGTRCARRVQTSTRCINHCPNDCYEIERRTGKPDVRVRLRPEPPTQIRR